MTKFATYLAAAAFVSYGAYSVGMATIFWFAYLTGK